MSATTNSGSPRRSRASSTGQRDCPRCGAETGFTYRKVCLRCRIGDRASELLDDGTGETRPDLQPLLWLLANDFAAGTVLARWKWLELARTRELLTGLATGTLELSHAALDALPDQQRVHHLRAVLVTAGCLPPVDPAVHGFGVWLHRRLATLANHPHERVLRQFGVWHHLARMRTTAEREPLRTNAGTYAQLEFNRAVEFCTWLAEQNTPLDQLTQTALDGYYQGLTKAHQQSLRGFLSWAITTNRMPRLRFTRPRYRVGEALSQQRRLELLGMLLDATDRPLPARVAGCILLLYAQPIPRILAITLDDITTTNHPDDTRPGEVLLRLGDPATPVPAPFSDLLLQLHTEHAAAGGDRWLFTGLAPGKPLSDRGLANHLRALGIPLRLARVAAVRQLVLDVPAPVVAQALGFHHTTTHRQNHYAGGTWNRYIAVRG